MHIYFSGIGGVGIGPLAEIAHDAGYTVIGSDLAESAIIQALRAKGIEVEIGQDGTYLEATHTRNPLDWFVYTAALPADHPELLKAKALGIRTAKRDELLASILKEKNLKLIAVAGTHGKTTTTGMLIWLAKYFGIPLSYSVGTTLQWGPSGRYVPNSEYFVYECDEFDRNFLHFEPFVSLITTIDYDHPDTYPTKEEYLDAFRQFASQSESVVTWREYESILGTSNTITYLDAPSELVRLHGEHNRRNASLILSALSTFGLPARYAADGINKFPGTDRRFERLAPGLYSDYGHTPTEIAATLQLAHELSDHVVLVYQPHQNVRQHEIQSQYVDEIFTAASHVYWLPTYLTREDPALETLTPEQLTSHLNPEKLSVTELDEGLWQTINSLRAEGTLVLLMGAGTIDGWAREQLARTHGAY
jgi:UDP-N-acetylmuramate--alanine ligase